jgi:hypothetical protein
MTDDLVKRMRKRAEFTGPYSPLWDEAADRIEQLETEVRLTASWDRQMQKLADEQAARIEQLEAALREIYEVYAGSEGIPQPISASEGYLLQLIKDMVAISRVALAGEKKDEHGS